MSKSITQEAIDYAKAQLDYPTEDAQTKRICLSRAQGALELAQRVEPSERVSNALTRIRQLWSEVRDKHYAYPYDDFHGSGGGDDGY